MKVIWTRSALDDLDDILDYTARHFPTVVKPLEFRLRAVVERLAKWPESARHVTGR